MADKKAETNGAEAPPPKKKGKLLLFIIIGALVVVLAGGGIAFKLMSKHSADAEDDGEGAGRAEKSHKARKDKPDAPPVFVKVEPFTVKLQTEQQDAYLQATPELKVLDIPVGDRVKQYMPEIRHRVLLILSGKKASDISTPQGVQKLSNEIRVAINQIIDGPKKPKKGKEGAPAEATDQADPDDSVQAVLFTSFIIQ